MDTGDLIQVGLLILAFLVITGIIYLLVTQPIWIGLVAGCLITVFVYIGSRFIL